MVHFVGAGPGAPDLITQRGAALLQGADCIIYAGSLVNPALLGLAKADCTIYNSAEMTLEQVLAVMRKNEAAHKITVRLHTGDPCLYGAIREQMDALDADGIPYDDTPGVSSFCGAAAALNAEYTLPGVSQTVIITRMEGRTPVPEGERLASLAVHGATMVIFLSIGLVDKVQTALLQGAYTEATPAAVVYKATWPEQKTVHCTVGTLAASTRAAGITKTALIVVGDFLAAHGATMVIFLSIGLVDKVQQALLSSGGYRSDTPAAVVYKATWPEQRVVRCTVSTLAEETRKNGITKTALIVVGDFLGRDYDRSKLYDPAFTTEFRQGTEAGK